MVHIFGTPARGTMTERLKNVFSSTISPNEFSNSRDRPSERKEIEISKLATTIRNKTLC